MSREVAERSCEDRGGLDPLDGHRVVEIGAVELINRSPPGQTFQRYPGALCASRRCRGARLIRVSFLADKPLFADIADDFLA